MLSTLNSPNLSIDVVEEATEVLRHCVTCGLCTATCPTYVLTNDDKDSPRGRNILIRAMLASGEPPTEEQVHYIDHCLSCLSCATTCPSGVDYMHLIDQARIYIERHHRRPWGERAQRNLVARLIPNPLLFSAAVKAAQLISPVQTWLPESLKPMLELAPKQPVKLTTGLKPRVYGAEGERRWRVALLAGCAQQVLDPGINEATLRLLNRHHCEVVVAPKSGCCGALNYHMGKEAPAFEQAKANIDAWNREIEADGLDAIIINASGCGTTVKDYAHMLRDEPEWAERAARVSALTRDITEFMEIIGLQESAQTLPALRVAYHSACSMQHGQNIKELPKRLLRQAGFEVVNIPEGHLCCGSAGTYNLFQADTAVQLRDRKAQRIAEVQPDLVAGGNIGCIVQLAEALTVPIIHTVELLDWATGGPKPQALLTS